MRRALTVGLLAALVGGPRLAPAQSVEVVVERTVRHGDIVTSRDGLVLPAGEFTIAEMIDAVARYLCRNYVYDPEVVLDRAPFRLQRRLALDALGSEEVLYALLAARGLAALPLDATRGVYHVVSLDHTAAGQLMATIPWRRPQDLLARPQLRELAMTAVHVEHLDARQVASGLRSHFARQRTWLPGAPSVSSAGERTLLLHGYGDELAQIVPALLELDRLAAPTATPRAPDDGPPRSELLRRLEALERELQQVKLQLARTPR